VARGYLNRAELTAEKFIPDPYGKQPGERIYKTGDLARYLSDGEVEFLGRADQQVKVRGYRIELGEIEAVINRYEGVLQAVVVTREDRPGDLSLAAYLLADDQAPLSINDLRNHLRGSLPGYMMPSAFVVVDEMPLMPNGKVDRRALAASEYTSHDAQKSHIAPRDVLELRLTRIWENILGVQPIGERRLLSSGRALAASRATSARQSLHYPERAECIVSY
jgi:acyl-coenzyme A synthetase/AMP-(fatty) acid ligase